MPLRHSVLIVLNIQETSLEYLTSKYKDDEDIGFGIRNEPEYENDKAYYHVTLHSIKMRRAGGTGTLAHVKVFEDGIIIEDF